MFRAFTFLIAFFLSLTNTALSATQVNVNHSLEGFLKDKFEELVRDFEELNPGIKITPHFAGNYTTSFEDFAAGRTDPHLLMVSEYNTKTMGESDRFVPIHTLLDVQSSDFIPVIQGFYSFKEGGDWKLYSLPFNSSAAALYLNKTAFKDAGLDPAAPLATWEEIEKALEALHKKSYSMTLAWAPAYIFEHFAVTHNIPLTTQNNGYDSGKPKFLLNEPVFVAQLTRLVDWHKKGYLTLSSRDAGTIEKAFTEGKAAILLQGANRLGLLKRSVGDRFEIGVRAYPYRAELVRAPYALNIGGASFWVIKGHETEQEAVRKFLQFLSSVETQMKWHQWTGYLPATKAAFEATKATDFYAASPAHLIAVQQVLDRKQSNHPNGLRISGYGPIREKLWDAIEKALTEEMTPQEALDWLVAESDKMLP